MPCTNETALDTLVAWWLYTHIPMVLKQSARQRLQFVRKSAHPTVAVRTFMTEEPARPEQWHPHVNNPHVNIITITAPARMAMYQRRDVSSRSLNTLLK